MEGVKKLLNLSQALAAFSTSTKRNDAQNIPVSSLMEVAGELVLRLDMRGEVLFASARTANKLGDEIRLPGKNLFEMVRLSDRHAIEAAFRQTGDTLEVTRISVRMLTLGATLWFELQMIAYSTETNQQEIVVVGRDISAQRKTEERLRHMATHDELTNLPNRTLLADRLGMTIAQSRRTNIGFSVFALDLDGFKKVNDALGHPVGDALLRIAAKRVRDSLRDIDTLARVGGDEFVALLPGAVNEVEIQNIARRMISAIQLPFEIDGNALYVSTSIGVAVYPTHGDSEVKLLARADTAMYRAKETGKARCIIYNETAFNQIKHDVSLEAAMFEAVRNGEFFLHYQPIVNARTRQIVGFEVLMRWMRPDKGLVPPNQFIPMAEDNGLINLLGAWVLKSACVQLKHFEEVTGRRLYMSVNVSPRQFRNDQFLKAMDDALELSGVTGDQLLLEITEGLLMSDPDHAEQLLTKIVSRGVRIAIDDFGTGYSSLTYLKRFPIAALKIDRTFIKDLPHSVKDAAICNVILSLANHLNLLTVAEGVENEQQMQFLSEQGCSLIQGFHTGFPELPATLMAGLRVDVPTPILQHESAMHMVNT